jgi:hypothetical protein|tara:strand:- start:813 stop:1511 length:699 start_codon:yes stop_codon:yes gene_type:complete
MTTNIELSEFDPEDLPQYSSIVACGSRKSGKGILTRDLVFKRYKDNVQTCFLFSPTAEFQTSQMDFVPTYFKYKEFDPDVVERILSRQEFLIKNDPKGKYHTLLIVDDIIATMDAKAQKTLQKIFVCGRHYQVSIIVCFQYVKREFDKIMRSNCDYVFCFNQKSYDNKESLVNDFLTISDNKKEGFYLMDKYATGFNCLVINNTHNTNEYEDFCFSYEAEIIKRKFKVGKDF